MQGIGYPGDGRTEKPIEDSEAAQRLAVAGSCGGKKSTSQFQQSSKRNPFSLRQDQPFCSSQAFNRVDEAGSH